MRDKENISGRQLTLLLFTFIIATGTLFVPSIVVQNAKQDGWISVLLGGIPGVIVVLIVTELGLRHPGDSLMEYSKTILGKWPGKVIGLVYVVFYIHITSIIVREISSTVQGILLPKSRLEVITIVIFIGVGYSVNRGLETITRANVLNLMVTFLAIFIVFALLIKDMDPELLTPVLAQGIGPVLKDSISPVGWFCEAVSIAFIMPFINKPNETRRCAIIGVIWATVTLTFMAALVIMIFGPELTSIIRFPTYRAVRYINVREYIQRVEITFLIPWIISNYIKMGFFYYISVLITSKWFNIEKTKTLVVPVGLVIFSLSLTLFDNSVDLSLFLGQVWGLYAIPIELGIPIFLLAIDFIRKKEKGSG